MAKYVLLKNDISILIREDNTIPYLILAVYSPAEREHYGIEMPDQDSKLYRSQDELERLLDASQRICILGAAYHPDVCERFMKRENAYEIR